MDYTLEELITELGDNFGILCKIKGKFHVSSKLENGFTNHPAYDTAKEALLNLLLETKKK